MPAQPNVIQHPDEFPIEFHPNHRDPIPTCDKQGLQLLCRSQQAYQQGLVLDISVPSISQQAPVTSIVERCIRDEANRRYELSLCFPCSDTQMRIRMLEQLCYIQRYRQHILVNEERQLDEQDAALEWIKHYAHLFPAIT